MGRSQNFSEKKNFIKHFRRSVQFFASFKSPNLQILASAHAPPAEKNQIDF